MSSKRLGYVLLTTRVGRFLITSLLLAVNIHISDANLRTPKLMLLMNDKVRVHFYNYDYLTTDEMLLKYAVSCQVSGGHLELTNRGWVRVTTVNLEQNPIRKVWHRPKITGGHALNIIRTRMEYIVTYDVEGNLTCHDTLGRNLVSNTILLQPINSASVLVKLKRNKPLPKVEFILKDYVQKSSSTLKPRLMDFKNGSSSEISLRVIYIRGFSLPDDKVVKDVKEWTESIARDWNLTVEYVRSTRLCNSIVEDNFTWPKTAAGFTTSPRNYCLDINKLPVPKRKCVGNYFHGVTWESPPDQPPICLDPFERSTSLKYLTNLLDRKKLLEKLSLYTSEGGDLSTVEIYFVSEALRQAADEISNGMDEKSNIETETIGKIVNSILRSGSDTVIAADNSYGSSKLILEAVGKLLQAAASPLPTPVSLSHFAAFASVAGTGIKGFLYSNISGIGKMQTLEKTQNDPHTVICTYKNGTNVSTTATYYNDGCLFSAANSAGANALGPVFGMKMFEQGEGNNDDQHPVQLTIVFQIEKGNKNLQCASWNPTVEGGWSTAGCHVLMLNNTDLHCICLLLKSVETFFTFIKSREEWTENEDRLAILPMRNNVGALLNLYIRGRGNIFEMEKKINCTLTRGNDTESINFSKIGQFTVSYVHKVIIFSLSFSTDGFARCTYGDSLISNECLLLVHNRAFVKFRAPGIMDINEKLLKYAIKHDLQFNLTKMPSEKDPDIEIYLVSQYSMKDHLRFMEEVEQAFNDMSALYNFTIVSVISNRLCRQHEEGGFLWPNTKLHHRATPINPCLNEKGVPIPNRLCKGDFLTGMEWEKVPRKPEPCRRPSNKTQKLIHLIAKEEEEDILQDISKTLEKEEMDFMKFQTIINILKIAADESTQSESKANITSLVTIVNKLVTAEFESQEESGELQVSSEELLDAVDKLLVKSSSDEPQPVCLPNFAAVAASKRSNLRGFVAVNEDSPSVTPIENIYWNDSVSDVLQKPVTAGAVLLEAPKDVGVTFSVFRNTSIFKEDKQTDLVPDTPVVGFSMFHDNNEERFNSHNATVLVFFERGNASSKNRECYFWNSKAKQWSKEGVQKLSQCNFEGEVPKVIDACLSTHLTHFVMLISTNESIAHADILHLLTLIGCSISLICLMGIFAMALISNKWRDGASKKIQMNLSVSIAMIMGCYLSIAAMGECPRSLAWCIALGVLMHYSVSAAFSWMVVVAVLQLFRLTPNTSMDSRRHTGSHLVLKSSIFGWGIPVIPVVGTLAAGLDNYQLRLNTALCYPSGRAFYVAVFFPITLAVTINTAVFIWLLKILFCNKVKMIRVHQKSHELRRGCSAFFLFCLLGITWVSGVFVEITLPSEEVSNVLSYLFCITATLQGAYLFIFFVACDRNVRGKMDVAMSSMRASSKKFWFKNLRSRKLYSDNSETSYSVALITPRPQRKNDLN